MVETKDATRLRELGCIPYADNMSRFEILASDNSVAAYGFTPFSKMNRRERRRLVAEKFIPGFICVEEEYFITDRDFELWWGPKGLDTRALTEELKFTDIDARIRKRSH
jgi:hypothetical protein